MSKIVALGEIHELEGFALTGVTVIVADGTAEVSDAWRHLDADVGLLIMSANAAQVLEANLGERPDVLTVVMP